MLTLTVLVDSTLSLSQKRTILTGVLENPQKHKDRTGPRCVESTFGQIHVEIEILGIRSHIHNGNFRQCPESI